MKGIGELEKVNLNEMNQAEMVAFFLNVYQSMYIHFFLKMTNENKVLQEEEDDINNQNASKVEIVMSFLNKVKSYVWNSQGKKFYYRIGGMDFTLDEIKHGVLMGNRKPPAAYLRTLSANDPKALLVRNYNDPRVNFVCLDFPEVVEHIDAFRAEDLDQQLDAFVAEIINVRMVYDSVQAELTLPKCLQSYYSDFTSG